MNQAGRTLVLPPAPHLPGRTPRPPEQLFEPLKVGLSSKLSPAVLASSAAFQGGIKAFRTGYYWEAHELWEAVWMCLPPASPERHLLQGLIQLANAGLKHRMGRLKAARRIIDLADIALAEAAQRSGLSGMKVTIGLLKSMRAQVIAESTDFYAI